jgi:NTE family protein
MSDDDAIENVLILQGGGSLGAFGCGVFKALANNNIKIDIVAGTSIGGVNASIIAGAKQNHPEKALEQYWLELADGNVDMNLGLPLVKEDKSSEHQVEMSSTEHAQMTHISQINSSISFYFSAIYGNRKVFMPRWRPEYVLTDPKYFAPHEWTYLFDHSPLVETLEKFVDFNKLKPTGQPNSRLIITAVNVLTAEPLIFDSNKQQITSKHILAATGYPTYYFRWVEVEKGVYAWDGSLLSNTPLREVIEASPVKDKRIFLVENYPKNIESLPDNIHEVQHRSRDIMFSDKTLHNIQMSKAFTYYLKFIDELYHMVEDRCDFEKKEDKANFKRIQAKYKKIIEQHGAEIKDVYYITREERFPSLYENADFSVETIKASINDGELKTKDILKSGGLMYL